MLVEDPIAGALLGRLGSLKYKLQQDRDTR